MSHEAFHMRRDALLRKYPTLHDAQEAFGPIINIVGDHADGKLDELETVNAVLEYLFETAKAGQDALVLQAWREGRFTFKDLEGNPAENTAPRVFDLNGTLVPIASINP